MISKRPIRANVASWLVLGSLLATSGTPARAQGLPLNPQGLPALSTDTLMPRPVSPDANKPKRPIEGMELVGAQDKAQSTRTGDFSTGETASGAADSASADQAVNADGQGSLQGTIQQQSTDKSSDSLRPQSIAQSVPTDVERVEPHPTDLTPVSLPRRSPSYQRFEEMKTNALMHLPSRLFLSAVVDNSIRLETNVYQTRQNKRSDFIYRILPNTTLGWALTRSTRISANYFFLRDQYSSYNRNSTITNYILVNPPPFKTPTLSTTSKFFPDLSRNFHNIGGTFEQDILPGFFAHHGGLRVTAAFTDRVLFFDPDRFSGFYYNDLLPQISVSKNVFGGTLYASVLGQLRYRGILNKFQEGDQFYDIGYVKKIGRWQILLDNVLDDNFGKKALRFGHDNQVIILTQEVARRLALPIATDVYCRTQEIFNIGANSSPGYCGYNFRVFGGIRVSAVKPPVFLPKLPKLATK